MTTEQAYFERSHGRVRIDRPHPPLFSVAESVARWSHQFGLPATDREWIDALTGGVIHPPQTPAAETFAAEHSTV